MEENAFVYIERKTFKRYLLITFFTAILVKKTYNKYVYNNEYKKKKKKILRPIHCNKMCKNKNIFFF